MTTDELKIRFERLQTRRDDAKANLIKLQEKVNNAEEAIKQIEEGWKNTYGFSTYEEAVAKIQELEGEINVTLATCEEYLTKTGVE